MPPWATCRPPRPEAQVGIRAWSGAGAPRPGVPDLAGHTLSARLASPPRTMCRAAPRRDQSRSHAASQRRSMQRQPRRTRPPAPEPLACTLAASLGRSLPTLVPAPRAASLAPQGLALKHLRHSAGRVQPKRSPLTRQPSPTPRRQLSAADLLVQLNPRHFFSRGVQLYGFICLLTQGCSPGAMSGILAVLGSIKNFCQKFSSIKKENFHKPNGYAKIS